MKLERARFRLELAAGELLRLDGAGTVEVACESGLVWLTEERDTRDVWLEAGERATLAGRGLAVLEAVQATRLTIG